MRDLIFNITLINLTNFQRLFEESGLLEAKLRCGSSFDSFDLFFNF